VDSFSQKLLFQFDKEECLLRLSVPRYLSLIKEEFGLTYYFTCKEVFLAGSLTRSELQRTLQVKYKVTLDSCLTDLVQQRYLIGVQSAAICDQPLKKREAKAQIKE
jgi:hypothetical protein